MTTETGHVYETATAAVPKPCPTPGCVLATGHESECAKTTTEVELRERLRKETEARWAVEAKYDEADRRAENAERDLKVLRAQHAVPSDDKDREIERIEMGMLGDFFSALKLISAAVLRNGYLNDGDCRALVDAYVAMQHVSVGLARETLRALDPLYEMVRALDELGYVSDDYRSSGVRFRRSELYELLAVEIVRRTVGIPDRSGVTKETP